MPMFVMGYVSDGDLKNSDLATQIVDLMNKNRREDNFKVATSVDEARKFIEKKRCEGSQPIHREGYLQWKKNKMPSSLSTTKRAAQTTASAHAANREGVIKKRKTVSFDILPATETLRRKPSTSSHHVQTAPAAAPKVKTMQQNLQSLPPVPPLPPLPMSNNVMISTAPASAPKVKTMQQNLQSLPPVPPLPSLPNLALDAPKLALDAPKGEITVVLQVPSEDTKPEHIGFSVVSQHEQAIPQNNKALGVNAEAANSTVPQTTTASPIQQVADVSTSSKISAPSPVLKKPPPHPAPEDMKPDVRLTGDLKIHTDEQHPYKVEPSDKKGLLNQIPTSSSGLEKTVRQPIHLTTTILEIPADVKPELHLAGHQEGEKAAQPSNKARAVEQQGLLQQTQSDSTSSAAAAQTTTMIKNAWAGYQPVNTFDSAPVIGEHPLYTNLHMHASEK